MIELDKDKSFITHIGTLTNGVKYEQGGRKFSPSGECLDEIKAEKVNQEGEGDGIDLTKMTNPEIIDYAKKTLDIELNKSDTKPKLIAALELAKG